MNPPRPAITTARGESAAPAPRFGLSWPEPCRHPAPCGLPCELKLGPERHAVLELGSLARLVIMAVPGSRGSFREQAGELFAQVRCLVSRHAVALVPTTLMVFLRDEADAEECRALVRDTFGDAAPVLTVVRQPPCCGAALGIELWALGGPQVTIERLAPDVMAVTSEGIRWVHIGGVEGDAGPIDAYGEAMTAFRRLERRCAKAGIGMDQIVRTWLYVNQITEGAEGRQRYQELNRARSDVYGDIRFGARHRLSGTASTLYPASTGIGTSGGRITMAALGLGTARTDVFIVPLENPRQTPACQYEASYSLHSPKFSRAMAVVQGHFVTTLVSGTASIVDSRTVHPGDVIRQTGQSLDNIEALIAPTNFARAGAPGMGATLRDVAKLRVYVKHAADYELCRATVEGRLPGVPAIYLVADVCRPDLLVEIEAVAFSRCSPDGLVAGQSLA